MTWLQQWMDVLFLHFPVPAGELQPLLPGRLEIDTYGGQAWLTYVFFRLRLRPAWLPIVPGFSSLLELNVRTYVRHQGQPGICFLRMFADNRLAIRAAQLLTPLCYEPAAMIDQRRGNGGRYIECRPVKPGSGGLSLDYTVSGAQCEADVGSIDEWLLERYRLFVGKKDGDILTAEVEHPPWWAAQAIATVFDYTLGAALGFSLDEAPALIHHSPGVASRFKAFHQTAATNTGKARRYAFAGCDSTG